MSDEPQPSGIETQLTRLADGSLPEPQRSELLDQVQRDPELQARLDEQRRATSLVRAVDVVAPDALRARLEIPERRPSWRGSANPRWRRSLFLPGATALAVLIAAIVLIVGYTSPAPTIRQTANVALAAATGPAPAPAQGHPELLALGVDGIPFPVYAASVGFSATGTRTQTIRHRRVVTVYYRSTDGIRVGYSIVPGSALSTKDSTSWKARDGVRYSFGRVGSGQYVTWVREGHTCVIAGRSVGDATLLALAVADEQTAV